MVLPFITSISRDVFATVPAVLKESAYGLGCTTREVVGSVVIPYTRAGIIGGVMLALGRALGETMAVTFVIGNSHNFSASLFSPGTTISATIASEFAEAKGLFSSALIATGLILFGITFIILAIARWMLMRIERKRALTWISSPRAAPKNAVYVGLCYAALGLRPRLPRLDHDRPAVEGPRRGST